MNRYEPLKVIHLRLTEIGMHLISDLHSVVQINNEDICIYANQPICHLCPHFNMKLLENLSHNIVIQIAVFSSTAMKQRINRKHFNHSKM